MLGKQAPVAGGQLRGRAVGPVFNDQLLLRVQPGADAQDFFQVGLVQSRALQITRATGGSGRAIKLGCGGQRKRRDALPLRRHRTLQHAQVVDQRLPAVRVTHIDGARPGNAGQTKRHRAVVGRITGVVGIGADGKVTVLVGTIVAPAGDHGGSGCIADTLWGAQAGAGVVGIKALAGHHRLQPHGTCREQIDQATVSRMADGAGLVGRRVLCHRPVRQRHHGPKRAGVVGGPGVIHAGVGNGQRTRHHRWPQTAQAHLGQGGGVPGGHHGRCRLGGGGCCGLSPPGGAGGKRQTDGGL